MDNQEKENKRTVKIFAWASFFSDMGSDMIYPIWPIFVTSFAGANMAVLGFIDGLGDAVVAISQAISGYWSDKIQKRKVFVWVGYLMGGLSRFGYALSTVWQHLIPFRVLDRAGKLRGSPRDAMVSDASTIENRGRNFGLLRTMDNLGAVVGIIICLLFVEKWGLRNFMMMASIPSLLAVTLLILFVKDKKPAQAIFKGISFKNFTPNFKLFLTLSCFFALASFSYSFLMIFASQAGFAIVTLPLLYLLFTAVATIFSLYFGKLSDKIGRKNVMMISYSIWLIVCLTIVFYHTWWGIVAAFALYGLHKAALEPVQKTIVAELSPANAKASTIGAYQMVTGLCALPASWTAGMLWDRFGDTAPFILSIGLTIVAMVMMAYVVNPKES